MSLILLFGGGLAPVVVPPLPTVPPWSDGVAAIHALTGETTAIGPFGASDTSDTLHGLGGVADAGDVSGGTPTVNPLRRGKASIH